MRGDIVERIGAFNDMLEKILKLYLDSALFDVFPRILLILYSIVIIRTLMGVIYPQFSTVSGFPRFSFGSCFLFNCSSFYLACVAPVF